MERGHQSAFLFLGKPWRLARCLDEEHWGNEAKRHGRDALDSQ